MYFDAIIVTDTAQILFNGTPEETVQHLRNTAWLEPSLSTADLNVCVGSTLAILSVDVYLSTKGWE